MISECCGRLWAARGRSHAQCGWLGIHGGRWAGNEVYLLILATLCVSFGSGVALKKRCDTVSDYKISIDNTTKSVYIRRTSMDANATLRFYDAVNTTAALVTFTAADIGDCWERLVIFTNIYKNNTRQNLTGVHVGTKTVIFETNSALELNVTFTNMQWMLDCDPYLEPEDEDKDFWKGFGIAITIIFLILILVILAGVAVTVYFYIVKEASLVNNTKKSNFVKHCQFSITSDTSASTEPQRLYSTTSRHSMGPISKPTSMPNGRPNLTSTTLSVSEEQEPLRMLTHRISSIHPLQADTQDPMLTKSSEIHPDMEDSTRSKLQPQKEDSMRKTLQVPSSPPPPPIQTPESMFSKSSGSLGDADHDLHESDNDDGEHDYDYLDISMLKQQLDKEKMQVEMKVEKMQGEMTAGKMQGEMKGEKEADHKSLTEKIQEKMEETCNLTRHDSENSLYSEMVNKS
ncbi:hypothetical protein OTU49_006701 [Cherax quadricarinatus]|uniref:Uncharacterized protein n=2 Tax=Cherax quadricarinatus TaxID=27406 RepID=A0AAW0WLX6_CHEQU